MDWYHAGLWVAVFLVAATVIVSRSNQGSPEEACTKFEVGDISSHTLAQYCGYDFSKPILVAVQGKVYDVTKAADRFGPGKPLHAYAGREVARALAKSSIDLADLGSSELHDLGAEEASRLREAVAQYDSQYDAVGQVVPLKQLTPEELAGYAGQDPSKPLYLAIKGTIFDISKGRQFYGPDGIYPFAGKECARALALMSTDEADCCGNLEGLGFTELDILRDWEAKFNIKYPVIGTLVAGTK
ncbi:cytochrome b5-like heme/steroid binding domain-containing protein [Dunaliella salina]|uniref:Cytochrome b5-like heme/steroid binding domain-containing protein n=1 Tax=Dunaliella salina TaxID=3046 RepID=A0ABQ7FY20_DUNSA|nr:cytochrome b5-like heme/steroid binding domain-containing protein [Dunaliella salina]|eukprot:KAF5827265.1 cytochrome b5-like heme/steroid binding domain-containing protein [Dunaliella salina]